MSVEPPDSRLETFVNVAKAPLIERQISDHFNSYYRTLTPKTLGQIVPASPVAYVDSEPERPRILDTHAAAGSPQKPSAT